MEALRSCPPGRQRAAKTCEAHSTIDPADILWVHAAAGGPRPRVPVLLPGGEVGILLSWWNAAGESEWRWQVEFYNQR